MSAIADKVCVHQMGHCMTGRSTPAMQRCALILVAALGGCADDGPPLSIEEGRACSVDKFAGHPGAFTQRGNAISYSYESPNGPAKVIVTFDGRRRPFSTFFESAPYGSHEELMDAAQVIKHCVAYGRKTQGSNDHRPSRAGMGKALVVLPTSRAERCRGMRSRTPS